MKAFLTILVISAAACGQSSLAPPQIGFIQDGRGGLRPVLGLAGNFLVGRPESLGVICAAYSGSYGLVKSDSMLTVTDQHGREINRADAPPGPALFAFTVAGAPALVYFEQSESLVRWDGRSFREVPFGAAKIAGESVIAIAAPGPEVARLVVNHSGELWELDVRTDTGAVVSRTALPGVSGPVLLFATDELVYGYSRGFVIRNRDGSEKQVAARLPKEFTLQQIGFGWVGVSDRVNRRLFALCLRPGRETYYELPGARP
jgi:hypothetical protein